MSEPSGPFLSNEEATSTEFATLHVRRLFWWTARGFGLQLVGLAVLGDLLDFVARSLAIVLLVLGAVLLIVSLVRAPRPLLSVAADGVSIGTRPLIPWSAVTGAWIGGSDPRRPTLVIEHRATATPRQSGASLTQATFFQTRLDTTYEDMLRAIELGFARANGKPMPTRKLRRLWES